MSNPNPKIIIIGAGASGIAAATRLLENGINDIIILEAENRIGGRIHSVDFDGNIVDLGGQWCHGEKDNIVYQLVKDLNLLGSAYNNYEDNTYYLSDGTVIEKSIADRLFRIAAVIYEDEEEALKFDGTFGDYFIKKYKEYVSEEFCNNRDAQKISELMLDWFHKFALCMESSESLFDISTKGTFQYRHCEGDQHLHWKGKGFKTILDVLMKKVPDVTKALPVEDKIFLNKEIHRITWDSNSVNPGGVTVECSDGSYYNADHVVVTVSLGVLKNLYKQFVPELPLLKRNAIEAMTIGTVNKILLKFPDKWWPDDFKGFSLVWDESDRKNILEEFPHGPSIDGRSWLEDVFGFYVIDSHPKVLLGWVVGKMAGEVESLSDQIVVDGCMYLLKKFAGDRYRIQQPDGVLRSKWKTNNHFNGSYTHVSLEAERRNASAEDLASSVINASGKQVLLFAGEATHPYFYSTVHGAIETGHREADRIINIYRESISTPRHRHHKVAIIGAGIAGLSAARTLQELGVKDFVILEAQDRAGGRILTYELDNCILELGAQFIHGKENPLYELAAKKGLLSEITSEEGLGLYIRDNGEIIDSSIVKTVDFEIGRILNECEKFVDAVDYPVSVQEFLEREFLKYLHDCGDSDDVKTIKLELFDWQVRFQVIDNSCLNLRKLSAKGWGQYVCIEDQAHFNLKCGYNQLVQVILDELPRNSLLLSTPVSEIKSSSDNLKLIGGNGTVFTCDYVIVTASLGVLKNYLKFTPPLPYEIKQSINDLGFYGIGKIFLIFDHKWWDVDGFQLIWRKDTVLNDNERWTRCITGFDPVLNAPNVLLGWVGGEGLEVMEGLSEEVVGMHCMSLLRKFIRDRAIPEPVRVIRSKWISNPWVRGAYCHITPECDRSGVGMHKFSEPVFIDGKPRILFAGEAAHVSHYSTVHGAFESGQQQAELLYGYTTNNSKL